MNRKSVYSLVLAVALAVSFAFPVFADDLATASDADYFTPQLLDYDAPMALATSEKSPLTVCVNNIWSSLYYDSSSYVTIPANATMIAWTSQPNSLGDYQILKMQVDDVDLSRFGNLRVRLKGANDVWFDDDFYSHDGRDGFYYFSAYSNESTIHFNLLPGSSFRIKVTSNFPSMGLSVICSGIYDSNDNPFKMSAVKIGSVPMFPFGYVLHSGEFYTYFFQSGGVLKKGFEYTFQFYLSGVNCDADLRTVSSPDVIAKGKRSGNFVTFTFTPTRNMRTDELYFYVRKLGNIADMYPFYYVSSSSTYIPASDTGQQGQVTAANTTIIKNVVTNISNTVSNISNQITTSTTTITNAVNNVANQVTGSINSQTNTLSDKIQGQTNTITDNQNQNTDKVIKNQDENTDKVVKNQDENTDKLTKNQDENTNKVTEKLEDVKTGIISGIIEGLKNLFIPSEDFFKSYFDDLYSWFGERLGFLSFPIDLLAELAEMFLGSSSTDCILTLPRFSISGFKLWKESSFNLTSFLNENFKFVLDAIKLGTSVILVFNFIHLCERKWEEVMMN